MTTKAMMLDQCVTLHWLYGLSNCCLCQSGAEAILLKHRVEELERQLETERFIRHPANDACTGTFKRERDEARNKLEEVQIVVGAMKNWAEDGEQKVWNHIVINACKNILAVLEGESE